MTAIRFKLLIIFLVFFCSFFCARAQELNWTEVQPGIWKGQTGKVENYDLIKASGAEPFTEGLQKLPKTDFPIGKEAIKTQIIDGKTYLRLPLEKGEQIYGLGLNFQTIHQRGKVLRLHVDHFGGKDNGRTHAPVPFYVSSKGYGIFINTSRYIDIYVGTAVRKDSNHAGEAKDRNTDKAWTSRPYSDAVEILVAAQGLEFFVFSGPKPLDAIKRYNLFFGGGPLPPRWGLGFTQRVKSLYTAADVEKEVEEFKQKGYPLDFIGLEPGWQSKSYPCTFEWDKGRYPDPKSFVTGLLNKGVRLNLWTNPYISPDASFYQKILPFTGSHTVWSGVVPDLQTTQARDILFGQMQKDQVSLGVSGYKIDEVDGYDHYLWPDVATFPSGISAEQMRQTYGVLMQRYSTEMFKKLNQRTYGLVRASNAGANSFPYVIYDDYYNHEDFITALINSGYSGVLWTPEVRASKNPEEWLRRMQTVIFSPMAMINAWSSSTKPWSFPEVALQVKEMALLRMEMMPYWYSEFAKYHFEGLPPFRGMSLEDGFSAEAVKIKNKTNLEDNPYEEALTKEIKDQYMAGENLLVAPLFTGQKSRKVVLPKGKWYDFFTGAYAGDGEVITVEPGLDKIPVYVKDGGIIPMMKARLNAPRGNEKTDLEIRYYGTAPGKYTLYDDDGESYNYEKGQYSFREIQVALSGGVLKGSIADAPKGKPNTIGKIVFKQMTKP
ncbi:glycoside hydrolase family 31 protein [Pedobacter nutrimenti]|uniref:Alpha-D-xyloside xylohydrolase n=1 Tax=Pedobacter nutrimenti TaxID=1241337 RepID=A0A318UAY6_9SPHI|nr:TIM-barrel domain-containing protein [Pedobacter nutrimenti]PYF72751.1 alpha-D-xyloside xylohydrolase [Pedobacter nutrimenti]